MGQPGSRTGPGGGKNLLGNWSGRPGESTRDPVHPVKLRWDLVKNFLYCQSLNNVVLEDQNAKKLKTEEE